MMIFFAVTGVVFVLVATLIAIESERAMRTYPPATKQGETE